MPHRRPRRVVAGVVLLLAACSSDRSAGPVRDDSSSGGGGDSTTIALLAATDRPGRLVARGDTLYWVDSTAAPFSRLVVDGRVRTTVLQAMPAPENALSDGVSVFWVAGSRLYRTPVGGGASTVLDEGRRDLRARSVLALDDAYVYWVNSVPNGVCSPDCNFVIRRVPKAGGAATVIASPTAEVVDLAVAGGALYWEEDDSGPVDSAGTVGSAIRKVTVTGGAVTTLVDGRLGGIIPPPRPGFIPASWLPVGGIATDGATVFFADTYSGMAYRVMSVPATGGGVTVLVADTTRELGDYAHDLALDDDRVYWVDTHRVRAIPRVGGSAVTLASTVEPAIGLARAGQTLYWLETVCCYHGQRGTIRAVGVNGGTPATLRTGIESPTRLTADASHLVWIEGLLAGDPEGYGRLTSAGLDGGGETVLVEAARGGPFDVGGGYLYFANGFTVKRVAVSGGPAERLYIDDDYVVDVATDGAYVYWVEGGGLNVVRRMPVDGGPVTTLAVGSGLAGRMQLDATHVYWMNDQDAVRRTAKAGGDATVVVGPVQGGLTDFAVRDGWLYYAEWDGMEVRRVPVAGGASQLLASPHPDQTRRLATDGASLYFIDQLQVAKVPAAGGASPAVLPRAPATSPFDASTIAVGATRLFWTEAATGEIRMATPK